MLVKSISTLVMLILSSLILGPLGTVNAQGPLPPAPNDLDNQLPNGAQQDKNELWYMLEGAQAIVPGYVVDPLTAGGPDGFGYTWDDTVAVSWIDVTGGVNTGLTGDGWGNATGVIALPFSFKYYENIYTQLYIAAPGYLSFTDAGYWTHQGKIPDLSEPNNVIAPYWATNYIGTGSWVRYISGGTAPNRYFVVEWHDVKGGNPSDSDNVGHDDTFRFETILYENGDIVFQYQAMTYNGSWWCGTAGIEDSTGLDGLVYLNSYNSCNQAPSFKAVRFYRPPSARVRLDPMQQGSFTVPGEVKAFQINILNMGELGSDTYDLILSTSWPIYLYMSDGVTPLTDTDKDGVVDTGPIPQGSTVTITSKIATPIGAALGDANTATVTATSSLNTSKSKIATLQSAVPAPFTQVYQDDTDGAMSLELVQPNAQVVKKATADGHYGYGTAVAMAPNGNFIYLWSKGRDLDGVYINEIEYTLLDHYGNTVRMVSKLIDQSAATVSTYDNSPSVAVALNGTIGVAWYRYLYNSATSQFNYNIYFAILDASGNMIYGPANITNNNTWGTSSDPNVPHFYSPTIAASDDDRFILSWEKYISYTGNIWYATHDMTGASVFPPTALTTEHGWRPVLNNLTGGKVMLTWRTAAGGPYYAVINSNGVITKTATSLNAGIYWYLSPDAVLLPNGKVAIAWVGSTGVQFVILNSSYILESGPTSASASSLSSSWVDMLSVTTDPFSHVIMTWGDENTNQKIFKLFYALGDSTGAFITQPMVYKTSAGYIDISYNGQGNVPYAFTIISGNSGAAGVTLGYIDGTPKTVTSDSNGNYTFTVPSGWSGTVTPVRTGFPFTPGSRSYSNVLSHQTAQNYTNSWIGGISITSDKNVVAVGRPHVGAEVASYDGFSAGALTAYIPMLFKNAFGGSYDSAFYIQNVDSANTANITIKYYDSTGALSCTVNDTVAALASKGYWLPGLAASCLPDGWVGGVVVTSDQPIVANGRPHIGAEVMTYDSFSSGSLTSYLPMLFKGAFGGTYNSGFYVQNVDTANTANLSIKYYDSTGALTCTVTGETVAPLASKGYWLPGTCVPANWVGGVVVTSDQPIVTVGRPHIGSQITTYNGFSAGSTSSYVPMLFKNAFGGGSYDSAFYVQNVGATAATVSIKYYDLNGNLTCTVPDSIEPLASKGYWLPGLPATCLPDNWIGGAVVTSDVDVVAIGRPHIGAQVTTYNGFTGGSLNSYLPMLFKDAYGGTYDSAYYLQNTEATAATVTTKFHDSTGALTCTRSDTLAPFSTLSLWVPSLTCTP